MRRYGAALQISEMPVPNGIVRKFDWEHWDIQVNFIARALALPGGVRQTYLFAGENYYDLPCPDGCEMTVRLTSRSAPIRPCESCTTTREEQRASRREEQRDGSARTRAECEAQMRSELEASRTAEQIYAEHVDRYEIDSRLPWRRELEAETKAVEGATPLS